MNLLDNFALGLNMTLQWPNLLLLSLGAVFGVLAVATRGLGLLALLAMLLPVVQQLDMLPALMMIIGTYCGANGGVVLGSASARAALPVAGSAMPVVGSRSDNARTGTVRIAPLLGLLAGLIGVAALAVITPLLIEQAFRFGPSEYFSLLAVGLMASAVLAPGSLFKSMATLMLGVMLAQIGIDPSSGLARFHFGLRELEPGLGLIPMALGVAVIARVSAMTHDLTADSHAVRDTAAQPARSAHFGVRHQWPQLIRGAAIGSTLGPVPGGVRLGGHVTFAIEERLLRRAGAIGVDPIDGASEPAAVMAAVRSSLVPLLAWGFPVNASLALLAGVMVSKQVVVGPQLMSSQPELFWGAVAALALASVLLFIAANPLARLALKARCAPLDWLPALMVICSCIGAYMVRNAVFDVFVMAAFAMLGHCLIKFGCRVGPLILGFVLGPALESNLRHALELSGGHWGVLVTRPISAGLLLAAVALLLAVMLPALRSRRARIFDQED